MRPVLVALALALAACASPEADAPAPDAAVSVEDAAPVDEAPASGFDAQAWLAMARALDADADGFEARVAHAEALVEAADWPTACDTYVDAETGETVFEPIGDGFPRGDFEVTDLGDGAALVSIVCYFGAYQGTYALARIDGQDVALLTAPALDPEGRPLDAREAYFGTPDVNRFAEGELSTFMKGRGLGDCGTLVRYGVGASDVLTVEEVRQRECGDRYPDDLPPPEAWPVVYTAD